MRNPSVEQIEYFGEKIAKRMKDFAVHNYKQPLAVRGRNCLDGFRKNSNQEWAQEFFMLSLECWEVWADVAKRRPELRGSKKILKSYESILKNKITMPDTCERYSQFNMMEQERQPERQQPTTTPESHQNARNQPSGGQTSNQPAQRGGRSTGAQKIDEAKALKAANDMKTKVTEVGGFLAPADEYEDYMQDIIDNFDDTYKQSSALFKPVISNPKDYKPELVESVQNIVSAVEKIDAAFEKFATGQAEFSHFKQTILDAVADLNSQGANHQAHDNRPSRIQQINPEQATVPKRDEKPVTNIDMNSYMSIAMNKRIEEDDEEDQIQLPDHMYGDGEDAEQPQKSPPKGKTGNDDPFPGDFNGFEDGDEPFVYQPEAMDEVEIENSNFNENSKLSNKQSEFQSFNNKSKNDSKFKFQEVESDEERDQMEPKQVEKSSKPRPDSLKLSHVSDSYQYSREDTPKPDKSRIEKGQSIKSLKRHNQKEVHNQTQEEVSGFTSGPPTNKASQQAQLPQQTTQNHQATNNLSKGFHKVITEEEKVKLAHKNQKALGDPTTQAAMADFFGGEEEEPASIADVFARAKMRSNKEKAIAEKKKNPPVKIKVTNEEAEPSWGSPNEPDLASPKVNVEANRPSKSKEQSVRDSKIDISVTNKHENKSRVSKEELMSKADEDQPADQDFEWEVNQEAKDYFETDDFFNADDKKPAVDFGTDFFGGDQGDLKAKDRSHLTEKSGSKGNFRIQASLGGEAKLNGTTSKESSKGFFRKPSETSRDIGERELEEYLKQKRLERQRDQDLVDKEGDESMAAKFRGVKGGLLEDGNDDYYAPPDIEKMKAEIMRLQKEKDEVGKEEVIEHITKAQKNPAGTKPAQPRRIDATNPPGYVMTALQREPIKNPAKPPTSKPGDSFRGKQSQNDSAVDVFQKSDFFNDFGSPVKLKEVQSRSNLKNHLNKGPREESFFDGDRSMAGLQRMNSGGSQNQLNISPTHISSQNIHPQLNDLQLENERLRRENGFLESEKEALDSKLKEVLTVTIKSLKTEIQQSGSKSLATKVKLLEGDLKLSVSEKEIYALKYKELYQKYKHESECGKERSRTLFDPKKLLDLSKLNTTLQSEKQALEKQLVEEREKSRNHSELREEFERTKAQLSSVHLGIQAHGKANESNVSHVLGGLGTEKPGDYEIHKPDNGSYHLEDPLYNGTKHRQSRGSRSPKGSSLRNSNTVKDIGGAGAVSNVNPADNFDAAKLDDSDLDFLGNFHKELDKALGTISGIDKNPYNFKGTSINRPQGRSSSSLLHKIDSDKYHTTEKKKISDSYAISYLKKPNYGHDPSDDQDLYKSVTIEEAGGYRSSSFCHEGKKNSARFGTTSNFMENLVDSMGKQRLNFDSFNPRSYQQSLKIPSLNISHKNRFSAAGPEWFGYTKKNFAQPERESTQSLLDPFNKIYDEIPLPGKKSNSSGIKTSGKPVKPVTYSRIDISAHLPPKVTNFSITNSQLRPIGQSVEPQMHSQESRTQKAKPAVSQRVDTMEILNESPFNILNFKACSVFNKGKLFIAKNEFEISCKSSLAKQGPKAEASLELTIKSLRDNFISNMCIVQQGSRLTLNIDRYEVSSNLEGQVSIEKGEKIVGIVKTAIDTSDVSQHTLCHLQIETE